MDFSVFFPFEIEALFSEVLKWELPATSCSSKSEFVVGLLSIFIEDPVKTIKYWLKFALKFTKGKNTNSYFPLSSLGTLGV